MPKEIVKYSFNLIKGLSRYYLTTLLIAIALALLPKLLFVGIVIQVLLIVSISIIIYERVIMLKDKRYLIKDILIYDDNTILFNFYNINSNTFISNLNEIEVVIDGNKLLFYTKKNNNLFAKALKKGLTNNLEWNELISHLQLPNQAPL
jgi:hypothetical protein